MGKKIDLRKYCSPVFDQGELGSCTANAASGMVGFYLNRLNGSSLPVSRLFIYKTTRNLMLETGDNGATIRSTMGSLALFGAPPEKYWEYVVKEFDVEPPAFCYSFASNYQALVYFKHEARPYSAVSAQIGASSQFEHDSVNSTLNSVKKHLCLGIPSMFGFTVYTSIRDAVDGKIAFPSVKESVLGGHAVLAVGFDDSMKIGSTTGALIIRNSWGSSWGDNGYGYLPYEYVTSGLAKDFWSMVKEEWVDTTMFGV